MIFIITTKCNLNCPWCCAEYDHILHKTHTSPEWTIDVEILYLVN